MDFSSIDKAIVEARAGTKTSAVRSLEEMREDVESRAAKTAEAKKISRLTYEELLPGLNYIASKVKGFTHKSPQGAFEDGAMVVTLTLGERSKAMCFNGWRQARIYITGRKVQVSDNVFTPAAGDRGPLFTAPGIVCDPSATLMNIDLAKDTSGLDKALAHVAVMAVEGPRHPGFNVSWELLKAYKPKAA